MAVKDYADPRWQMVRLRIMERDNFQCKACGSLTNTLHVHHRVYEKKKKIWEAEDSNLITLCENCHERAEKIVCGFREIADRLVFLERCCGVSFEIESRFHDMVASSTAKKATSAYMSMAMDMLDAVTSMIVTRAEDFERKDGEI